MNFLGIDPGKSGGYVWLNSSDDVEYHPFSENLRENYNFLKRIKFSGDVVKIIVENVHAMPGQGVSSMFSFGRNLGQTEGLLTLFGFKWTTIQPRKWQDYFVKPTKTKFDKNVAKALRKKKLIEKAKELYPDSALWDEYKYVQNACTDALLIAHYLKATYNG